MEPSDIDFFNLTEDPSHLISQSPLIFQPTSTNKVEGLEETSNKSLQKSLQKLANDIIEQLYVDEVILAMD